MAGADSLRSVFTPEVLNSLSLIKSPSDQLRRRLEVLAASGLGPADENAARRVRWLRAQKAAWEAYLDAAFACGLFEGNDGRELRSRLAGIDDDNFRSAIAECMVCWFLTALLKLQVTPRPTGSPGRVPDLCAHYGGEKVIVEVKAPFRPFPTESVWWGNDSSLLAQTLDEANRQFAPHQKNVLAIVTNSDNPFFGSTEDLVRAFFGEDVYQITFNRETGETVDERLVFAPKGKFLKRWGGTPRFTRTSAVLRIRERSVDRAEGQRWIEPEWVVLHNPYCPVRVPEALWGDCPQFVIDGDVMRWNDGRNLFE